MRGRQQVMVLGAVALAGLVGSACASAPPTGARPAAFPGAPPHTWAPPPDRGVPGVRLEIRDTAVALRGAPYQLGGATPTSGFDCSGLVRYVFARHRFDVPRTVAEQFRVGHEVARSHVGAGDLVFFSTIGPGATHVGIVVDPDEQTFVHAPGTGAFVRVERFDTPYWRTRLIGVRRLAIPEAPAS